MTTKRRRGTAKKKQRMLVSWHDTDGVVWRVPAGEVVGRYIEMLQRDAEETGNRWPLDAFYERIAEALGKRALAHPAHVVGGKIRAQAKLANRDARVDLIRESFDPQADRAACIGLRVQVEALLQAAGHVPPMNRTSQINEIVEALVVVT